ncbi:mediator of RNA polymerase II transcription subunit 1 [Biomphalaria glabrata]|nr:mediator of RNA polymerase II transcription subunit 1-like [Biomphalaria glabrata]
MAAETGIPSVYLEHQLSHGRAAKRTQESFIDRLKHKNSQNRSWNDSIKIVKSSVAELRQQPDVIEDASVQKCLDTIQKAMKVISQQTLKERLDSIGRQLGMSTSIQEQKVSLSSDAFHVDVLLDGDNITSVKLANQGDVVDCPDLKDILRKGDFSEFIEHLQGLQSIYQVTNDEKLKSKAFLALQALEKDLNQLSQFQSSISGVANYIHKCPLGIMLPRLAGKPMKLIYFVSPYDLLDKKSLTAHPLTVEAITENFLGQSVTVCLEPVPDSASPNKLQTMPLMNVSKTQEGKSLPSFSAVTKINSMMLPASFVLVLPQPLPISMQLLQKITMLTNLEIHQVTECKSLCSLVLETYSDGKIQDCRKLFVSLPDQRHIYFLDGLNGVSQDLQGVMVSRIPFTHPTHVPQILNLLRQQLLFNIVLSSCIRPASKKEVLNTIVFEVTTVSLQQLTIVFEHPAYDSMITVDIDLTDITNLKCHITCTNHEHTLCTDDALSKVFQRCMSIPIMLRWLVGIGRHHLDKLKEAAALAAEKEKNDNALFLKELKQRQAKLQATMPTKGRPPPQPPHPTLPPPPSYTQIHYSVAPTHSHMSSNGQSQMVPMLLDSRTATEGMEDYRNFSDNNLHRANNSILLSPGPDKPHNPLLSTLLEDKLPGGGGQPEVHDSPMLSRLLDDNISVATNVIPMTCKPNQPLIGGKRQRKRKSQSEMSGPSPKHRFGDSDSSDRMNPMGSSMDLDMGPGLMSQGLSSTPPIMSSMQSNLGSSTHLLHHHPHSSLNHAASLSRSQGNVIDLTEDSISAESSLKKLVDSVDKHFPHKDQDLMMFDSEASNRIPNMLQNSPSGSKNENASTSLEVYLKGSGEVGRAKDFDPSDVSTVHVSKLSTLLLAPSDSPTSTLNASSHKANSSFFSDGQLTSDNRIISLMQDIKPHQGCLLDGQCSNPEHPNDKQNVGIFEKFDRARQQQVGKVELSSAEIKSAPSEGKVSLKLRVGPLKQQNSVKPVVKSADKSNLKSNSITTFDFKSDEDEDETLLHYSDSVYSSSPTRLQISSGKHKRSSDASISLKTDKVKKKDRNSSSTTKRKREKEDSKREKKRKKNEHIIQESVYRTVENDSKTDFKLKIRVAKKPVTEKHDQLYDGKIQQSYEISKKSSSSPVEKIISNKQEVKEASSLLGENVKVKDVNASVHLHKSGSMTSVKPGTIATNTHKPSIKSLSSKPSQVSDNKTDTKLVSKATIRLKPLNMPNSGSTVNVNISQSGSKTSSTTLANSSKSDRRSSTSAAQPATDKRSAAHNTLLERRGSTSGLVERRNSLQSSSSATSSTAANTTSTSVNSSPVTTSANLSLSSILPNAPTGSKIASLPRIPKLPSSSNTLINRTSSLDPITDTSLTPQGTKANNSYNTGPAGRVNSSQGTAAGRPSANNNAAFNYNRQNFNANRMQSANRQTSPGVNAGQISQQRAGNIRPHHPSGSSTQGSSAGQKQSSNSHKTGSSANSKSNNNPNASPKTGTTKINISGSSTKLGHSNLSTGQKSVTSGANAVSGQRQSSHGNIQRTPSNSSNVSRSPNTSSLTKSPSSGKSPNLSSAGRSPSLSTASKSPNITSGVNKSPNISSGVNRSPNISSGKSPNINASKSPNLTNHSSRPSPSSKSVHISSSHKQSANMSKSSNLSKGTSNVMKTPNSSINNVLGSSKSSHNKAVNKTIVPTSNNQISKTISLPSVCGTTTVTNAISSATGDNLSSPGALKSLLSHSSHSNSAPLLASPGLVTENLLVKSVREQVEHSNNFKDGNDINNICIPDKLSRSTSSTPTTPMSADSCKTKFPFPSSRGRKNSLSAIVDKLKHNAVGGGLDLLVAPSEGFKASLSTDSTKLQTDSSSEILRLEENKMLDASDTIEGAELINNLEGRVNHAIDSLTKTNDFLGEKSTSEYTKALLLDTEGSNKYFKTLEDKTKDFVKLTDTNLSMDLNIAREKNKSDFATSNSVPLKNINVENKKLNIKNKDKPSPLRILPTPSSPVVQSPVSGKLSPSVSPFHTPNSSPSSTPSVKSARVHKDTEEQIFKIPSVKPAPDQLEDSSDTIGHLANAKNGKLDVPDHTSGSARDNQDQKVSQEQSNTKHSSVKVLSSPLSDISSPENGLVIDDEESSGFTFRSGTEKSSLNNMLMKTQLYSSQVDKNVLNSVLLKPQLSPHISKDEVANSISQIHGDKSSSPMNNLEGVSIPGRLPSARSPALAKNPSGASTPKRSDSPCEIDDDLMDEALGFGS